MDRPAERFDFVYTITPDHFVDVSYMVQRKFHLYTRGLAAVAIVWAVILFVVGPTVLALGSAIFGIALVLFSTRRFLGWRFERAARSVVGSDARAELSADGVAIEHRSQTTELDWADIGDVKHTQRTLVFSRESVLIGWIGIGELDLEARESLIAFAESRVRLAAAGGAGESGS